MIPSSVPGGDIWVVAPELKAKYDHQFYQLHPMNGFITGDQAKGLFLQSGLPPQILAHIWALADRNGDGKMDLSEFCIAMHLIQLKLKGLELPKVLPQGLQVSVAVPVINASAFRPAVPMAPTSVPSAIAPLASGFIRSASPVDAKLHRSGSVSSQDSPTSGLPAPLTEWAISQQSKLKYTQLFNSYDRTRTGFLTGAQAKNLLIGTGLSQPILAQIWSLSDIDSDGRLSSEEFVLAMHLTECAKAGDTLPKALPLELIPPSHRRKRSASIQSTSSSSSHPPIGDILSLSIDLKEDKLLQQTTFEDKRRQNFEQGQAELEKRRLALLESQRKEQEERDRKDREEQERRERIRQEQEKRRQLELEKQLAKQRELEQEKEEQRRKALEQREAARREMERQRQLEWEKQRLQELITQRQKEQETVCHLKNRNKSLSYELEQVAFKIAELCDRISDTRAGVTEMKSSIDNMRIERDTKLKNMNEVKGSIKEMNDRLLILSQEKMTLMSQMQEVGHSNASSDAFNSVVNSFNNKKISLHRLQISLDNIEKETTQKEKDIENSNTQLEELKQKINDVFENHKNVHSDYEEKRQKVVGLKKSRISNGVKQQSIERFEEAWGPEDTAANDWGDEPSTNGQNLGKVLRYRILFAFEARNADELPIMPGDIVLVPEEQSSEPGWLGGELHGKRGWFPEAYAELIAANNDGTVTGSGDFPTEDNGAETVHIVGTEMKMTLEGISEESQEAPTEALVRDEFQPSENSSFTQLPKSNQVTTPTSAESPVPGQSRAAPEGLQAQALFPWKAKKENHLSFNKNDVITVTEQQDMWWYGDFDNKSGWFPKSYVKLISGPMRANDNAFDEANDIGEPPEVTAMSPPSAITEYYLATYAYQSQEPGDLCFQPGDIIAVFKKDGEWWTGVIEGGRNGIFPSNYVRKMEPNEAKAVPSEDQPAVKSESPSSQMSFSMTDITKPLKKEIVTVLAPYRATGAEQLSLERGQLVQVRKKSASGWWEGEVQVKGRKRQVGWFPASYVRPHTGSAASSARSTPEPVTPTYKFSEQIMNGMNIQNLKTCEQVVALFPFAGQHSDELTFQKGDIITLLSNEDPAWWRGELNGAVGLFPSNYVEFTGKSITPATTAQWFGEALNSLTGEEKKRQHHIHELINTEESYMSDMSIVLDAFQKPLREVLTKDELRSIFVNWKELIVCNTKLLRAMRVRHRMSSNGIIQMIGDILCENLPRMMPYIRFCSCQLNAAALIQQKSETDPKFKEVSKKCSADPRTKGMPLSSYLLKPMQRITRYPLLIQKILNHTPKTHPDFPQLEESLNLAEQLCNQVNEGVRERENSDRLEWIQNHVSCDGLPEQITFNSLTNCMGPRKLIHVGILYKAKSNKELMAFLFNDFLLLTQPVVSLGKVGNNVFQSEKAMTNLYKMYKQPLFLNEVSVKTTDAENTQDDVFVICYRESRINVKTTVADKLAWCKKIEEATRSYIDTETKKLNQQKTLLAQRIQGVGRLLVVVVEASNLKACTNGRSNPYCEVSMGSQEHKTKVVPNSLNPRWSASMQFLVKDLMQDVLCISVFDRDLFSPNEFLGRTEIRVSDIHKQTRATREPLVKQLTLYEVESGEVNIKLDLQLFEAN